MEKKFLIALIFIAATSLLWVFHFMGRDTLANPFVEKGSDAMTEHLCQNDSAPAELLQVLKPGFAVHENTHTRYVLRDHSGVGAESVEKVRVVIEQPSAPRPAATECEQRKIDKLKHTTDEPHFCIESLKVLPSKDWPDEYEFLYQRWRGTWSDLEAFIAEPADDKKHTNWGAHSPNVKSPPSI